MHRLKLHISLLFLLLLHYSHAQVEEARRVAKELTLEKYHGRGYVNKGDELAAQYIRQEFQTIGLQQLSPGYFQSFSFPVNTFNGKANFSINGHSLKVGEDVIIDPASPAFKGSLSYLILTDKDVLDGDKVIDAVQQAMNGYQHNAIALDFRKAHPDTLKLIAKFKYELAQFVPVVLIKDKKFVWSVAKEPINNIIVELKDSFFNHLPIDIELEAKHLPEHVANNVIGFLPASKKTKKTIVFTAHYDHLGRIGEACYFPGASDNASGVGFLISLAQYYKKNPSKEYNIVFIAFAAEEIGLLGSKHYVEHPLFPLKDIKFLINLDLMGTGEEGITVVNGTIFEQHFNLLTTINNNRQLTPVIKARGYAANSDHYWFSDAGVPAFFIYTMGPYSQYHDIYDQYDGLSFAGVNNLHQLIRDFVVQLKTVKFKRNKKSNE